MSVERRIYPAGYWDRPSRAEQGDAEIKEIYAAVGMALSQWETLETLLSGLFALVTEARESQAAQRAYGSIISSSGRCEALRAAGDVFFNDRVKNSVGWEVFGELVNNVRDAASRRNEIAHGVATTLPGGKGAFLVPADYATKKVKARSSADEDHLSLRAYGYTSKDILFMKDKFRDFTKLITEYQTQLFHLYHPEGDRAKSAG